MTALRIPSAAACFIAVTPAAAVAEDASTGPACAATTGPATINTGQAGRCEVWQRELEVAGTVAAHDHAAFAELLHPHAACGVSGQPTIGREAIRKQWQGILDGSELTLAWSPDVVTVGGDRNVAYSSGPTLYQDLKRGAYRHGRHASVWSRDSGWTWQVVFDDGTTPQPADVAAVAAFGAGRVGAKRASQTDCAGCLPRVLNRRIKRSTARHRAQRVRRIA